MSEVTHWKTLPHLSIIALHWHFVCKYKQKKQAYYRHLG